MQSRRLCVLVSCLLGAAVLSGEQTPAGPQIPTFRSGTRVIEIDAVVRDTAGNFVPHLTKDDFEILEDGDPQEIVSVAEVNLPVTSNGRPMVPAEGAVPARPAGAISQDIGRVYVMVLGAGDPERIRRIARQFVAEFLGPDDLMAVMHGDQAATQGLTNNPEHLLGAIDRFAGGGGGGSRTLKTVAVNLGAVTARRKAILLVGTAPPTSSGLSREVEREYDDAVRTAVRNGIRIYPVDPRGFLPRFADMTSESIGPVGWRCRQTILGDACDYFVPGPAASGLGDVGAMDARILASDTGGFAITNTGNYAGQFRRIVRDNSQYYVLAFSSDIERDARFHRITVRVKDRPDVRVRARAGYHAAAPDVRGRSVRMPANLSAQARDALRAPEPLSGLPLDLFTAVFQAERYEGSVLIGSHVAGASLDLTRGSRVELTYAAIDRWGTVRAAGRRSFTLTFNETMQARVRESGLRLFGRLQLPRGTYEIRTVVHQPGGATGSAVADVEVPDYTDLPMSVSDLVVVSARAPALVTLEEDAVLRRALPAQPTAVREFPRADTLTVFGEVYDSHWLLARELGVTSVIQREDGRVVQRDEQTLRSGNQGRFYYTGRVPLETFAPGRYVLTVEAYTRDGVPAFATRQLRFVVGESL